MLYRLYCPEDFAQLYAIEKACFEPPLRFPRRYMRELVDSPNSAAWIAEEDGQMAGFAIVEWSRQPARDANRTVAYILTIEVAPRQRRRGVASELLRRAEASSFAAGASYLWLHVAESNADAIALYRAHGYCLQGREEDFYAEGIAALIFSKNLA